MMQYMCKYTPVELIKAFGVPVEMPNHETEDLSEADTLIHNNVCSHARQLLLSLKGAEEAVLTNCCDSVRRVADVLGAGKIKGRTAESAGSVKLYMLDLPHTDAGCAIDRFAGELERFVGRYASESGRTFDRGLFLKEWRASAEAWAVKMRELRKRPYVALLGARVPEELLVEIRKELLPLGVADLTCLGSRDIASPPEDAEEISDHELMRSYAEALLHQIPCMRMASIGGRRQLTEDPALIGIIYNTVRFCDYYEFEFAGLRKRVTVPMLKIETDYTSQTRGQLRTRLEAFGEQMKVRQGRGTSEGDLEATRAEGRDAAVQGGGYAPGRDEVGYGSREGAAKAGGHAATSEENAASDGRTKNMTERGASSQKDMIAVGIDSGSTTTNVVAVRGDGEIAAFKVIRTGAKASVAAETALKDIEAALGKGRETFGHICATGYGRANIPFANSVKTEITCHARGAHKFNPETRCVIDIGGQDSKVICLDADGQVSNFIMNDKCAAGTGRFLEMMARTLELDVAEMDRLGLLWKHDLTISSTCTVFAESEVISLIAEDKETPDIIHGLNKSVAARTYGLVRRARGAGPFMMTGGVARNPGLVKEIEAKIGEPLYIAREPDLAGALGAALFALEECGAK